MRRLYYAAKASDIFIRLSAYLDGALFSVLPGVFHLPGTDGGAALPRDPFSAGSADPVLRIFYYPVFFMVPVHRGSIYMALFQGPGKFL